MRNHNCRFDKYEQGEACTTDIWNIVAPVAGGLLSFLGSQEEADAIRDANEQQLQAAQPQIPEVGQEYLEGILGDAADYYQQGLYSPLPNALTLLGRESQLQYGEGMAPEIIGTAQNAWGNILQQGINPYVGSLIDLAQHDLVQDFQRNILPSIDTGAISAGGFGGARHGVAQGIAAEGLLESMGDVSANMLSRAYADQLNAQLNALNMTPSMTNIGLFPGQIQQQIGNQYTQDVQQPALNLQGYMNTIMPWIQPYGGASVQPSIPPSALGSTLGGALTGYGLYNQFTGQPTGGGITPGAGSGALLGAGGTTPSWPF